MTDKICAVIVVYGRQYFETSTFKSLIEVSSILTRIKFDVIIYDNSPQSIEGEAPSNMYVLYKHDPRNLGVVPAYQFAKKYCEDNGIQWLLRLDQDSSFGSELIEEFISVSEINDICAVVPKITCNNVIVSPSIVHRGGRLISIPQDLNGRTGKQITFINSMSFINIFNPAVPMALNSLVCQLDLSDHEFAMSLPKESIYVLPTIVKHSLSILDHEYVSVARYKNILIGESYIIRNNGAIADRVIYKIRIAIRTGKFLIRGLKEHAWMTFCEIWK